MSKAGFMQLSHLIRIIREIHFHSDSLPSENVQSFVHIFQVVTVNSLENDVVILPTKTRPKKIVLVGSDGQKYVKNDSYSCSIL